MLASLKLINKFVAISDLNPLDIKDRLTFAGLEVEGISYLASGDNLVIGEILEVKEHPESNHLHILQVNLGAKYGIKQIVCGAPNVRVGLKVIVARVGSNLPALGVRIVSSAIRGVTSEGMCCSLVELGVDKTFLKEEQINGIEELPDDAVVGNEEVLKYLELDDCILDINVLANRSDCLAIFSLAKELGALYNREVKLPVPELKKENDAIVEVSSETTDCPQFSLQVVKGVKTKPSPLWLSRLLMAQGIRSINNVVDIGNYIMILTGQPLHMYDMDKLGSKSFVVKNDYQGEFVALDQKAYQLEKGDLVITNNNQPVCLAGVMGALSCAVDEKSSDIAIEAANFNGARVRRTSTRIGLGSDSSSRFVKGINPSQDQYVLDLATRMLIDLADAKIVYQAARYQTQDDKKVSINTSLTYINRRLGTSFTFEEVESILTALGIKITSKDKDSFVAIPPVHRIDLVCAADITEEVIRFAGLDRIKSTLPLMEMTVGRLSEKQKLKRAIREHLVALGLDEVLTYNLISPQEDITFNCLNSDQPYRLLHPMTSDHSIVRRGLLSSLISVLKYNLDHQNKNIAIFEVSDIITQRQEYDSLCVVLNGEVLERGKLKVRPYDFYDIKGIFDSILSILGIEQTRLKIKRLESEFFHPGRSIGAYLNNQLIAVVGQIHPSWSKDIKETYALEINLGALLTLKTSKPKMHSISRFPAVSRDYALVVKEDVLSEDLLRAIKKAGKSLVVSTSVIDQYQGEHIKEHYQSVAINVVYQSEQKTLTEAEINDAEKQILASLESTFAAELRK